MAQESAAAQTQWHRLLGQLLEELLTPVGITVLTGFPIMTNPPEADVLLLRREGLDIMDSRPVRSAAGRYTT